MRVLMVTPGFYPIKGGTETMVLSLSIELNQMGVHTDVMTFNMDYKWNPKWRGNTESINRITVFRIPGLNWLPMEHSTRLNQGINLIPGRFTHLLKRYDIIHFHETDFSFPLFSILSRKPKIFHLHGIDVDRLKRYHISRLILKSTADYYIAITKQMKKELIDLGIPGSRITYLPNGIDTRVFQPKGEKINNLILFVGRIEYIKGLHVLLESLKYVDQPVNLVIIGPKDWGFEYYKSLIDSIKTENRRGIHKITYLGPLDRTDLVNWYQKASFLVSPSLAEAFGLVNIEALSCGTPVIATPVGGVPEVVQDGANGILIPPNDHIKLAKAIKYLLEHEDVRAKMGREGMKWVHENFSIEVVAKKLTNIYRAIINE